MDEQDLRSGLRALTRAVPPAPPSRTESAVRRSVRIRRSRAVVSVATAAALVVPAALWLTYDVRRDRVAPLAGTPISEWPDLRDRALDARFDEGLREYDAAHEGARQGETVRPLFAGQVTGSQTMAMAFAYCGPDACSRAVLGLVDHDFGFGKGGVPGLNGWLWVTREVRDGVPVAPLAALAPGSDQDRGPAGRPSMVVFVVTPPEAVTGTWRSERETSLTGSHGTLRERGGTFFAEIGWVQAPVDVRVAGRDGRVLVEGMAGDPDSATGGANEVAYVPPPEAPEGLEEVFSASWRVGTPPESRAWAEEFPGGTYAVVVTCRGGTTLTLQGPSLTGGIPCDGEPHRLDPTGPAPAGRLAIVVRIAEPYVTYGLVVAGPDNGR